LNPLAAVHYIFQCLSYCS